jgi:hypothetical protein
MNADIFSSNAGCGSYVRACLYGGSLVINFFEEEWLGKLKF